jgi:hypothetical protein
LYVTEGVPEGYEIISSGVEFEPKLLSVSPNEGSVAGSTIYAAIAGVGLDIADATLVDIDGNDICLSAAIT